MQAHQRAHSPQRLQIVRLLSQRLKLGDQPVQPRAMLIIVTTGHALSTRPHHQPSELTRNTRDQRITLWILHAFSMNRRTQFRPRRGHFKPSYRGHIKLTYPAE